MIRVYADVPFTRRKTYHIAIDATGAVIWRTRRFDEMLGWLRSEAEGEYVLCTERFGDFALTPLDEAPKG